MKRCPYCQGEVKKWICQGCLMYFGSKEEFKKLTEEKRELIALHAKMDKEDE